MNYTEMMEHHKALLAERARTYRGCRVTPLETAMRESTAAVQALLQERARDAEEAKGIVDLNRSMSSELYADELRQRSTALLQRLAARAGEGS